MEKMKCSVVNIILVLSVSFTCNAQDSLEQNWTTHFQFTVIAQKHSGFRSAYSGMHSLADTVEPIATSITGTLFIGRRMWKGAALYLNPEISGGKGLSFAQGVAGALNGETYRVGSVAPQVYIARAYLRQVFPLGASKYDYINDDENQLGGKEPKNRVVIIAGKFSIDDFFDDNAYSKDPRTQFFNWSIWANGAWDYPANTRGYTEGLVVEIAKSSWKCRVSGVAVPRIANYHLMEYKLFKACSQTIELEHDYSLSRMPGKFPITVSNSFEKSPSYKEGIKALAANDTFLLNVISGNTENNKYGGKKTGIGFNAEQQVSGNTGMFLRTGWNDGKYASWAFTEIDNTFCLGLSSTGAKWKRPEDVVAVALATNGISKDHQAFLRNGGYGFIIGDGHLNYGRETILETYYSAKAGRFFWLSFDYQFVNHPAYNKDRGPVHVFGIRGHVEF